MVSVFQPRFFKGFIQGGVSENFEFKINNDTQVLMSCSSILKGEVFLFGGYDTNNNIRNQVSLYHKFILTFLFIKVSKIVGCELKRIGDLNYDFYAGACGTYNFPDERILLCFSEGNRVKCERSVSRVEVPP